MNLFIDTNVFLRFYSYTDDRLEEIKKLIMLIDKGNLVLYVPRQLIDEINRNREGEIKKTYKELVELKLEKGFPYIFRSHDDFTAILKALSNFYDIKKKILEELGKDILEKNLKADLSIKELLAKGKIIETLPFVRPATLRMHMGNPPGKIGKMGDAIIWECLINSVPDGEDLFLISKDSDYQSLIDEKRINGYLEEEWKTKKSSKIFFYQSLTNWASTHQKDILLKLEDEKSTLIDRLLQSESFSETHLIIENLSKHADFSVPQINQLLTAGAFNSQVKWILDDEDVEEFFRKMIKGREKELSQELLSTVEAGFKKEEQAAVNFNPEGAPF